MEVCTTNNNSSSSNEHHLATTTSSSSSSNMLRGSPFQREVREWQRIDPTTGALLTGRLEADRWISGPLNSYGKISDSQNIAQPNGLQQTQRKQLEVLQSHTANGAMQVIRARTVQTTSSRWSSNNSSATTSPITNGYHNHSSSNGSIFNNINSNSNSLITNDNHHYNYNNYKHNHMFPTLQALAPQLHISTVGSDVDCDIDDDVDVVVDEDDVYDNAADDHFKQKEENHHRLHLINSQQNYNNSSFSNINSISNISSNSNNLLSNFLLLDTAPSLKLSNLMKSSSSVSSNSNSSIATTASNMHASSTSSNSIKSGGGKISLHTIVGNSSNNNNDTLLSSSTSSSSSMATQQLQQRNSRLYEQQHPTFGKINSSTSSFVKTRVGGSGSNNDAAEFSGVSEKQQQQHQLNHQQQQRQPQTMLTPTQLHRQQRRDLESFLHYNDDDDDDQHIDDDDDADTLRLTARHQRRQQTPTTSLYSNTTLQRSISTDDLSTEWDLHGEQSTTHDEPSEWRRVSKLRRSFQSSATKTNNDAYASPTAAPRRPPLDLPESSVSVSKIRAELEAGRRLTTAMRNNHVDLAALQNILDAPTDNSNTKSTLSKRSSFLTAESLKEIRGKLKKLSDESLYKEDFITQYNNKSLPAQVEHIEVPQHIRKPSIPPQLSTTQRRTLISPEKSPEIQRSAFQFVTPQQKRLTPLLAAKSEYTQKHTTNSLESRLKTRDTTSAEWHMRRKSYGFEKMSPPDDKSMSRMDASTDSGLGRSGELANWSPTEAATRATVVQFGEPARLASQTAAIQRRQRPLRTSDPDDSSEELKRHSIAVDESHYVRKTSQVHLNGFPNTVTETVSMEATRYDTDSPPNSTQRSTQQKRVEFCKTEVHFAAESGRVNIVETDGKPPPTNNFRRRRRTTSGPLESLVKTAALVESAPAVAIPVTRFGDDNRPRTISSSTVAYKAALLDTAANAELMEPTSVTVSLPKELSYPIGEGSRSSYTSTSGVDTTDNENDEIAAIRGILKNKPVKPKPYHLGENFDSADALWGVQLKPIGAISPLQQTKRENYDNATKANSPPAQALSKSVAERVRIVERRQDTSILSATTTQAQTNGYSTKINLSLGETTPEWKPEQGMNYFPAATQPNFQRRPSAQELLLQDLKEHQKILDEGLKSTSLIIKTMRSATEFDEAMRRLSIASNDSTVMPQIVVPTPMLRSNSYQETTQRRYSTASSFDESERNVVKSASYSSTSSLSTTLSTISSRRYSSDTQQTLSIVAAPTAAPRLKLIGNTEIPVSHQLSQLRRMYEVAAAQDSREADSADEEVKHYFRGHADNNSDSGGGTQESSSLEDERATFEYSSSWSRLKAKRTIWQIEADERREVKQELPKSNLMSIELHSPQATLEQKSTKLTPVAKPRTLPSATIQQYEIDSNRSIDSAKEQLKIIKEARGARKLREHELSYFGVQVPSGQSTANPTKTKPQQSAIQSSRRTLPQRHRVRDNDTTKATTETRNEKQTTSWHLINDKPDLLRHSPIVIEPQTITRTAQIKSTDKQQQKKVFSPVKRIQYSDDDDDDDEDDEHFYENVTNEISSVIKVKPLSVRGSMHHAYNRKTDLERDERILSEMTHTADQTMKALSDEHALKDQRRRSSLTRRTSKPLETITEKVNDAYIAANVARSTMASEARRTSRHSTPSPTPVVVCSRMRTSSQSSTESCPRARSRSLSSEREYENIKVRPTTRSSTKLSKPTAKPTSRSSSRDSQRSSHTPQVSSGDEQHNCRRDERLRTKTKRLSSSSVTKAQQEARRQREHERKEQQQRAMRSSHASASNAVAHKEIKSKSGSTTRSSQRERVECATTDSSRRHRRENELVDPHRRSSSSRRSTATAEKHDEKRSGNRLVRSMRSSHHQHHDDAVQRSSNRSERSAKEKEKEKLSRSKGHSSQSTQHHSSNDHSHHQHNSSPSASSANKVRHHHSSNSGEHKKSKSGSQHHDSATTTMTHSKNAQISNGISAQQQQQQQHYHQHPQQHVHSMTTATITAKQRERHGKDRK